MITASEARKLMYKEVAIKECKHRTEEKIKGAINRGMSRTCLSTTSCYLKEDGTIGGCGDRYVDCTYEIKEWLKSLGYRIEPTGYSGGVWQKTEDICW